MKKILTCENCGGAIYLEKEDACYIGEIPFPFCQECYISHLRGENEKTKE